MLQAACVGIKLLRVYFSQKCHAGSFFEGEACYDEGHDKAAEYVALNSKQ